MATLLDLKREAFNLLAAAFQGYEGREQVDVFYGHRAVRSTNRFVVVSGGRTMYENQRLAPDTMSQYDEIHSFNVDCCSGVDVYSEETAERNCRALMDVVLETLARPSDAFAGMGVYDITPLSEEYLVRLGEDGKPQWNVLQLTLELGTVRS